jgi:tetratricopeptide (TPR) repeat protein
MGFELTQVLSDDKHYSVFVCGFCQNLVDLDAVVTAPCSHASCRQCWHVWVEQHCRQHRPAECLCPTCRVNVTLPDPVTPGTTALRIHGVNLALQPLAQTQPLAFRTLQQVQVACLHGNRCDWSGDYGDVSAHAEGHAAEETRSADTTVAHTPGRPSLRDSQSHSMSALFCRQKVQERRNTNPRPVVARTHAPATPQRKSRSLRGLLAGEQLVDPTAWMGSTESATNASAEDSMRMVPNGHNELRSPSPVDTDVSNTPDDPVTPGKASSCGDHGMGERWATNEADHGLLNTPPREDVADRVPASPQPESPRWTTNGINDSISTNPSPAKAPITPKRDEAPNLVKRTKSEEKTDFKRKLNRRQSHDEQNDDLEVSYSQSTDWNMSINSLGANVSALTNDSVSPMETVNEIDEIDFKQLLDSAGVADGALFSPERVKKMIDKAEKLKKQANAKFNKGDLVNSRELYTDGIKIMRKIPMESEQHKELVSQMYSNRAVTYFREKRFDSCALDCDKAIELLPTYEKSWIRKWRALMALGDFEAAYNCLETGSRVVPDSRRIQAELTKTQGEKELLFEAKQALDIGDFQRSKDILKPHARTSDNIGLLFLAAKADVGLGNVESALEKINKALRFNPTHSDGLELRGHTLFLSGDTEKGVHILQETFNRDKQNGNLETELNRCQNTHVAITKGRASVKRGRYAEAADFFSAAIKETGLIPTRCPLFEMLRTERAEAWLLSKKYLEALKDCQEVILIQRENATAWTVRAEVLAALGKPEEARRELLKIKRTWGAENPTIEEGYRRVDFELRVTTADKNLTEFIHQLEMGNTNVMSITANMDCESESKADPRAPTSRSDHRSARSRSKVRSQSDGHRSSSRARGDSHQKERRGERRFSTGRSSPFHDRKARERRRSAGSGGKDDERHHNGQSRAAVKICDSAKVSPEGKVAKSSKEILERTQRELNEERKNRSRSQSIK